MPIVRARTIMFPVDTRTGPNAADYARSLSLDDPHFQVGVRGEESYRVGEIVIDEDKGFFLLKSPCLDRITGEPLRVRGSMVNVSYEELSEAQARKYYPSEFAEKPAVATQGKPHARA